MSSITRCALDRPHMPPATRRFAPWAARWRAVLGVGGAALLLAACGGGGAELDEPKRPLARPDALSASQPGELLAFMKERLDRRWAAGIGSWAMPVLTIGVVSTTDAPAAGRVVSGSTVVEAGVDEEDLIKADGRAVYSLALPAWSGKPATLEAWAVQADGSLRPGSRLAVGPADGGSPYRTGMHFAPQSRRLAVIGQAWVGSECPPGMACIARGDVAVSAILPFVPSEVRSQVTVEVVAGADPAALASIARMAIDGELVGTRRIGEQLYVVTRFSPRLAADALPPGTSAADRKLQLDKVTTADLLPMIRVGDDAARPLVADTDCWLQGGNASLDLQVTTVTRIDLASPALAMSSRCIAGGSEALSLSASRLALATTRQAYSTVGGPIRYAPQAVTDLHLFSLGSSGVDYLGSGSVPGHLGWDEQRKPLRLSEHQGDLRVLSFNGETGWLFVGDAETPPQPASPATLTVLRPRASDRSLQPVGQLPNAQRPQWIGKAGEQVHGVRFAADRAYVVTFRRTDPLYVLDLANPADPKVAGVLEVPGFSEDLHPLPGGLLFGVGRDADAQGRALGVKVGLFDVADPTRPRELASQVFGTSGSHTALAYSRQGIGMRVDGSSVRIALPMFVAEPDPKASRQGLQRFEVTSGRLLAKPMDGVRFTPWDDGEDPLWAQRTVQIDDRVHWLHRGTIETLAW